ncbi:MAG: ABC transporter permease [Anaerolineales bacterium]|nr:MAG: ABC transporter permease [Anaerolineales bacterium]
MRIGSRKLKFERRVLLSGWQAAAISIVAILVALALFSLIFILAGINPLTAYVEIFTYAFANPFGIPLTINRFIFLMLCTFAFILPSAAGLWNIGMAGQLYAGALCVYAVLLVLGVRDFQVVQIPVYLVTLMLLLASMLGGALLGGIAGYLKGKFNVNEIVVTMMLNFMTFWVVSFFIKEGGIFMNPGGRGESFELPPALQPPLFLDVPFTIFIAIGLALLLAFLLKRTKLGYEIRAYGENPTAAAYAGISRFKIPVIVFLLGGALAGLAGYHYFAAVPGVHKIARNYGYFGDLAFYGIICGLISQGNPLAAIPVALLFGGLSIGGRFVQGKLGMSFGVDFALLGVIMITLVAFQFFYRYKIVWVNNQKESRDVGVLR